MSSSIITIDAGHGGHNMGAVPPVGYYEKDLNQMIAWYVLHSYIDDCVIYPLRAGDEAVTLKERGQRSRTLASDLTISIHVDNLPSAHGIHGLCTYSRAHDAISDELAQTMLEFAPPILRGGKTFRAENTPVRADDNWLQAPQNVLEPHGGSAVLVECGYLSNPGDRDFLMSGVGQAMVAWTITMGILRFQEIKRTGA